nr:MAG TPA: hypothetical protein [Caudoviricetes sp.]
MEVWCSMLLTPPVCPPNDEPLPGPPAPPFPGPPAPPAGPAA